MNESCDAPTCCCAVPEADFYISPDGDDRWSGTQACPGDDAADGPFATLTRARDAVRAMRARQPDLDVVVLIRQGTYTLREIVVFDLQDSAPEGTTTTYAAYPGETSVFTSSVPVLNWRKVPNPPVGTPPEVVDHLWVADLPAACPSHVYTLYDGDRRLPRARSAGFLPMAPPEGVSPSRTRMYVPPGVMEDWSALDDVEMVVRPSYAWVVNILQLASVDQEAGVATVTVPATYPLLRPHHFVDTIREACWVENTFGGLMQPGNWVLRSGERKVYLWPQGETPGDQISVPCLRELVRVEGEIDCDGPVDTPVRGLVFRGLTFTHGDRDVLTDHDIGLQHDWELFDKANALLRLRGTEDCVVEACHFAHSGGTAIRLDLHAQRNRVIGNLIEHVGATGILLAGYGAGTKDVNKSNTISNNHIHHIGEIFWHAIGVFVWQSGGNTITHNLIHNTGYDAIVLSGLRPDLFKTPLQPDASYVTSPDTPMFIGDPSTNSRETGTIRRQDVGSPQRWRVWLDQLDLRTAAGFTDYMARVRPFFHTRDNLVGQNEVHHVMAKLGDGNAIYLSDVGRGNRIRHNYIHDLTGKGGQSAIRTDAFLTDTLITHNIIHRCNCGGLNLKYYGNHAGNNFIVDVPAIEDVDLNGNPVTLSFGYLSVGDVFPRDETPSDASVAVRHNIVLKTDDHQPFYRMYCRAGEWQELGVENCDADYNLYYAPREPDRGQHHLAHYQALGLEMHSAIGDPGFSDLVRGDFSLSEDSPALALGIDPIDTSQVGLIATLPHYEHLGD